MDPPRFSDKSYAPGLDRCCPCTNHIVPFVTSAVVTYYSHIKQYDNVLVGRSYVTSSTVHQSSAVSYYYEC